MGRSQTTELAEAEETTGGLGDDAYALIAAVLIAAADRITEAGDAP